MGTPCRLILFSILLFSGTVSPIRHNHKSQPLIICPLSSPQSPLAYSWPEPQDNTMASFFASSIQLHLHHVDTLSPSSPASPSPPNPSSINASAVTSPVPPCPTLLLASSAASSPASPRAVASTSPALALAPLHDTSTRTSSFYPIPYASPLCRRFNSPGCSLRHQTCLYQVSYGDGSFTMGDFSMKTLTFHRARVGPAALGCGHDHEGLFVGAAGLLSLSRGRLSFPSQAGPQFNNKCSYCLVDWSASCKPSTVIFGDLVASSRAIHFTLMHNNPKLDTFYYVELLVISVGGARVIGIRSSLFRMDQVGNGGVILDSGTLVTRLTQLANVALRDAFQAGVVGLKRGPDFSLFDTCYDLSGKTKVKIPTVVLHCKGEDISLPASNYLILVDSDGTFCFAFAGTMSGLSIIGNIQQQGFRVVFDLAGTRVRFIPRGCA